MRHPEQLGRLAGSQPAENGRLHDSSRLRRESGERRAKVAVLDADKDALRGARLESGGDVGDERVLNNLSDDTGIVATAYEAHRYPRRVPLIQDAQHTCVTFGDGTHELRVRAACAILHAPPVAAAGPDGSLQTPRI